jgi:hypothetical protein
MTVLRLVTPWLATAALFVGLGSDLGAEDRASVSDDPVTRIESAPPGSQDEVGDAPGAPGLPQGHAGATGLGALAAVVALADRRGHLGRLESSPTRGPPGESVRRFLPARPVPPRQDSARPAPPLEHRPWSAHASRESDVRPVQCTLHNPRKGNSAMRLLSIAIATALVGICGGPALAGECPMLQTQMERQVNNRFDSAAYTARENMKQASALQEVGGAVPAPRA